MGLVGIVGALALLQFVVFSILVGRARGQYNVPAPAMTGSPEFERYLRVQMNTAEQLLVVLPSMFMYAYFNNPTWAAGAGAIFIIGRIIYFLGYVQDPSKRSAGFIIGFVATAFLLIGSLIGAIGAL